MQRARHAEADSSAARAEVAAVREAAERERAARAMQTYGPAPTVAPISVYALPSSTEFLR